MPRRLTDEERADRALLETAVVSKTLATLKSYGFRACHWPDSRRLVGQPGCPDVIGVRPPHLLFIECKRQVNVKYPPHQKQWQDDLARSGARVLIVQPADLRLGRLDAYLDSLPTE